MLNSIAILSRSEMDLRNWRDGTDMTCSECDEPTGFCEEDGIWTEDGDPLCSECAAKYEGGC